MSQDFIRKNAFVKMKPLFTKCADVPTNQIPNSFSQLKQNPSQACNNQNAFAVNYGNGYYADGTCAPCISTYCQPMNSYSQPYYGEPNSYTSYEAPVIDVVHEPQPEPLMLLEDATVVQTDVVSGPHIDLKHISSCAKKMDMDVLDLPECEPIYDLIAAALYDKFDWLRRDENGTIVLDGTFKQICENIVDQEDLDSRRFDKFYDYFYSVNDADNHEYKIPYYSLKDTVDPSRCRYINDILPREEWQRWQLRNRVYIAAGTGRGKNTFIKEQLLKHIPYGETVVIFENRDALLRQQVVELIEKIDPEALTYRRFDPLEDNMYVFGKNMNIMLISYQKAAIKCLNRDERFFSFCLNARYLVFDEAHYILDDSEFNKGITAFAETFLKPNRNIKATKIFMSGSMEEFFRFAQKCQPFEQGIYKIGAETDEFPLAEINDVIDYCRGPNEKCKVLSIPTDYSYIIPRSYTGYDDIAKAVASDVKSKDKWLIFVDSINNGNDLKCKLIEQGMSSDDVCFINAENKKTGTEKKVCDKLIQDSKFDQKVLIATTVIYNGVNIKDDRLKHMVLPFATIPVTKQLIGRKRIKDSEPLNVYFPNVTAKVIRARFSDCIRNYFDIMDNNLRSLKYKAQMQLNGLSADPPSKYYYVESDPWTGQLELLKNAPAIEKLYFDTMYYIFLLQRITYDDPDSNKGKYTEIMLKQLGIDKKNSRSEIVCAESEDAPEASETLKAAEVVTVEDITIESPDKVADTAIQELATYLESLVDKKILSNDSSHDDLLRLKEVLNKSYRTIYEKDIDSHWRNHNRFFARSKIKSFLKDYDLPYSIESHFSKGEGTTVVTRQ